MTQKHIITLSILLILVGAGGVFIYLTRPVSAPSESFTDISPAPTSQGEEVPPGETVRYTIQPSQSSVGFEIDEVLRDEAITTSGVTNQIEGTFTAVGTDVTTVTMSTVRVNARTLATDSSQRDGAIARAILKSEDPANEFIVFEPTSVSQGMITGNLTVSGVTKEVTFIGSMNVVENRIVGEFRTTILRSDFGLVIPSVPNVASVADEVIIGVIFTAIAS